MKTIHIIFNAHIDPIWLWPWQSGLDELLATCRSACDRLDAHPDIRFTRGEAWVYDQVERIDSALFTRMRAHIDAGRWEIVGGWWIQPDCNQPSGFAMEKQISVGLDYFENRFGYKPRSGYNVDSFGHSAALPGIMRGQGQDRYVMMRPEPHETTLPASLFRWRGYDGGPEVTTYRIVAGYAMWNPDTPGRIERIAADIPDEIGHGMLFAGIGDHGGGPTERQIAWFREHWNDFPSVELKFSTVDGFFNAVADKHDLLPVVTGELQHHAIGCYSVYRPMRTMLRKAEHMLFQAEVMAAAEPQLIPSDAAGQLTEAWKRVAFNQFHDTLGGTCLPSAYAQPLAQLGYAQNVADDLLHPTLRRKLNSLPNDPKQRIVLYNASDRAFDGPVEYTPWLDWKEWGATWRLIDEGGDAVPFQCTAPEQLLAKSPQLLFPLKVDPGKMRILRIVETGMVPLASQASATHNGVSTTAGLTVDRSRVTFQNGLALPVSELVLIEDTTDTWSHGIDRYAGDVVATARWDKAQSVDDGPLMASFVQEGRIGDSSLTAEWRVYGVGFAELKLTVDWHERHKLLKLVHALPEPPTRRTDGVLGGWLDRPLGGREVPIRDGILLEMPSGKLGIASPDVYAADGAPDRIRFTLLRSAIMAHHDPHDGIAPRRTFTDHGENKFLFRYFAGDEVTPELIDRHATQIQRPLVVADLTRGMPCRRSEMDA